MAIPAPRSRLHRSSGSLLRLLAIGLLLPAATAQGGGPEADDAPPAEASAQVVVSLEDLSGDVWGGDGEGLPAIWEVVALLEIENRGDEAIQVQGGTWRMPLGERPLQGRIEPKPFDLAPGESRQVSSSAYLPVDQLEIIREGVRKAELRQPRRLVGVVVFTISERGYVVPFTLSGRWRGCMDERPAREPAERFHDSLEDLPYDGN